MKTNTNNSFFRTILSICVGIIIWVFLLVLYEFSGSLPGFRRVIEMLGGSSQGYIQILTYIAFLIGYFDLMDKKSFISHHSKGFNLDLLPQADQLVLNGEEVMDIKLKALALEKKGARFLLLDFVKKTCAQYRNNNSISETLQVLDMHIGTHKEEQEGGLSMVKYMASAIMSLGFIGTLFGLSKAIGNAHLAEQVDGMSKLTGYLNVAFDTTLIALVLGLILNYSFHRYLSVLDGFYAKTKSHIVENLVSRIYTPNQQI